jgi:hypothetical protein
VQLVAIQELVRYCGTDYDFGRSEARLNAPSAVHYRNRRLRDASSWNGVIERLRAKRVQVTPRESPLRGRSIDSAYLEIGGGT